MVIGSVLLTALGGALLATLLYAAIAHGRETWPIRQLIALIGFGAVLLLVALSGPIRIGQ